MPPRAKASAKSLPTVLVPKATSTPSKAIGKKPSKSREIVQSDANDSDRSKISPSEEGTPPPSAKKRIKISPQSSSKRPKISASPTDDIFQVRSSTIKNLKFKKSIPQSDKRQSKAKESASDSDVEVLEKKDNTVYYEDIADADTYSNVKAEKPPFKCEVTNKELFDHLLRDTYNHLPPLRSGILTTSNNGPEPSGPFELCQIPYVFEDADMGLIVKTITFKSAGIYVNPSRAAPHSVKPGDASDASRPTAYVIHANAQSNFSYSVFTSVVAIANSNLHEDQPSGIFRQISGTLCTQEWERFCAFFCMVFKTKELHAQIYEDAITFSTRSKAKGGFSDKRIQGLNRLLGRTSPSKSPVKVTGSPGTNTVKSALSFEEDVPIYDGRQGGFDLTKLSRINQSLKRWTGDVTGCVGLVGYTANTWMNKDSFRRQLSLNIQWIIVLAAPKS